MQERHDPGSTVPAGLQSLAAAFGYGSVNAPGSRRGGEPTCSAAKCDMTDEAFLSAILASPEDDAPRLVYADWLEERRDPRGEYLRIQSRIEGRRKETKASAGLRKRLVEWVRPSIRPGGRSMMTLGRPFRAGPRNRDFFDCDPSQLHLPRPSGGAVES